MADFKFGDMVCYTAAKPHDGPLMYVGPCGHAIANTGALIDIYDPVGAYRVRIEHKNEAMWQRCTHLNGRLFLR